MIRKPALLFFYLLFVISAFSQQDTTSCGQTTVMRRFLETDAAARNRQDVIEQRIAAWSRQSGLRQSDAVLTLPVVVHIVHQNGAENISDAQVLTAIQHLNEAFANSGAYQSAKGIDTKIQFCLAKQDPAGNLTNGITRTLSSLTYNNGANNQTEDIALKNTSRWNPNCYINIWIVASISGSVAGYAYLPSAHGSLVDGIVIEAQYFGSSPSNDVVVAHEMGHYLGLYHTFQNGCTNNDCQTDGDKVCDTPPDNSTSYVGCSTPVNSCSTDQLSGFSTDQNDNKENFLDYGNWNCMNQFTDGQKGRMRWHTENVRASLLGCYSCQNPCNNPVTGGFTTSGTTVIAGATVNFTNTSSNAATYQWSVNGTVEATTRDFNRVFNEPGQYVIKMRAISTNPAQCAAAEKTEIIFVNCPVQASFSPAINGIVTPGQSVTFTSNSTNATAYAWKVNGATVANTASFTYTFNATGTVYISLVATNGICSDSAQVYYLVNLPVTAGFTTFHKQYDVVTSYHAGMYVYDAVLDAAGNSVMTGMHNDTAFVASYDGAGNLNWSRRLQHGERSIMNTIKRTADNGFILGGMKSYYCFNCYVPWLVKLDASGNIQWSKEVYDYNLSSGDGLTDLIQLSDGGFAILFRSNSSRVSGQSSDIGLARLNAAGGAMWVKYFDKSTDLAGGLAETADGIVLSGMYKSASNGIDALLIKVNKNTGNFIWAKTYDSEGKDNHFQKVVSLGNKLVISGYNAIYSTTATDEKLMLHTDNDGNIVLAQKIKIPNTKTDGKGIGLHADGSYTIAINSATALSVYAIQFAPDGTVKTRRKYNDNGYTFINAVMPYANGIYLAGYRGYDYMALYKTDANFSTPGCNDEDFAAPITTPVVQVTAVQASFLNLFSGTLTSNNLPATTRDIWMDEHYSCNDFPVVSSCDSATFKKHFSGVGAERLYDMVVKPNGNIVICGVKNVYAAAQNGTSAFISEISPSGNQLNSYAYAGENVFTHLIATADNGYLAAGTNQVWDEVYGSGYPTLTKLDGSLALQWTKKLNVQGFVRRVLQTQEGNYVVLINLPYNGYLVCMDGSGNVLWSRKYGAFSSQFWDLVEDGNTLVMTAYPDAALMKLDKSNGNVIWSKTYAYVSNNFGFPAINKIVKTNAAYYLCGTTGKGNTTGYLLKTDRNGGVIKGVTLDIPGATFYENLFIPGGSPNRFILCLRSKNYDLSSNDRIYLVTVDSNLNVVSSYQTIDTKKEFPFTVKAADDKTVYVGGYYLETAGNGSQDLLYYKLNLVSTANNCNLSPVTITATTANLYTSTPSPSPSAQAWTAALTPLTLTRSDYPFFSILKCFQSPCVQPQDCDSVNCAQLSLVLPDKTCNYNDTLSVKVSRKAGCTLPVKWSITPSSGAFIVSSTDSLLKIRFTQNGRFAIQAKMQSACLVAESRDTITVQSSPGGVNLGADSTLCPGSVLTLRAGKGFASYQWQDGSDDSTLTVYLPGTYSISARDVCGNVFRDTVNIASAVPANFDLGPDRLLCNTENLTLTAPAGFSTYSWAPNYGISGTSGSTVTIAPTVDTVYVVTAVQRSGCSVIDSVRVRVQTSPKIELGSDTSFCQGTAKLLDAGAGFVQYSWSTGQTTQQVSVNSAGEYRLEAKAANGCISRDTFRVLNVHPAPVVNLGRDTGICSGTNLFLSASGGNYTWSDGSTGSQLTVADKGLYWVRVTNSFGCQSADSLEVIDVYEKPSGFLAKDTVICPRDNVVLVPRTGFADYVWSDGSRGRQFSVGSAGTYWLEVTSSEGCTAREYVSVKETVCKQILYFPSAFTPNSDGRNDLFRPQAFGRLVKYKLAIFNRWGQLVFQSNDVQRGWDGTIGGQSQVASVFVWQCQYQFDGEPAGVLKGTVTLIR